MEMNERIADLRRQAGLTQDELSLRCGFKNIDTVFTIESNNRASLNQIKTIANVLHTTVEYIRNGIEPEFAD